MCKVRARMATKRRRMEEGDAPAQAEESKPEESKQEPNKNRTDESIDEH